MNKTIVVINGLGGVGKDTFIDLCKEYVRVLNISSVDNVKMAAKILGWTGSKSDSDRRFLSDIKKLAIEYDDSIYKYIKGEIEKFKKDKYIDIMFIHSREPAEIERLKHDFGCLTLLIVNKNIPSIDTNESDKNVGKYNYDLVIDNSNSLSDLNGKVKSFIIGLTDQ
jgi:dephospho-CoA kinase